MATLDQVVDAIIAEAVGEGDDGMAAVAWTMQNRANERGKSITDVVNGRAYSGLSSPGAAARRAQRNPALRARVEGILNAVQTGAYPDPTGGATHYWAPKGMPGGKDPYWADEEASRHGQYRIGNHVYLPKREPARIPPGYINEVATLTDTVRKPPTPAAPSPRTAALRQMTSPTGGNADLVNYVQQAARAKASRVTPLPRPSALQSLINPGQVDRSVAATAGAVSPALQAALNRRVAAPAQRTPTSLLIHGNEIDRSVAAAGASTSPSLLAALTRTIEQANNPAPRRSVADVAAIYRNGGPTRPAAASAAVAKAPRTVADVAAVYRNGGPTRPATAPTTAPSGLITMSMGRVANKTDSALQYALESRVRAAAAPAPAARSVAEMASIYAGGGPTRPQAAVPVPRPRPLQEPRTVAIIPTTAAPTPAQRSITEMAGIYRQGGPTQPKPASVAAPRGGSSVLADYAYNTSMKAAPQINANTPIRLAPNANADQIAAAHGQTVVSRNPIQVAGVAGGKNTAFETSGAVRTNGNPAFVRVPAASVPLPSPRPDTRVATQLSVVPPAAAPAPASVMLPALSPVAPAKPAAPAAPTTKTVMREERVENPAYKTWQASQTAKVNTVPLGMQTNMGSRDSVAQAAKAKAELAAAPTPPPARYITRQTPVTIRVPAPAAPAVAKPAPAVVAQPVKWTPAALAIGEKISQHPAVRLGTGLIDGLAGMFGGPRAQPELAGTPSILSGRMSLPQMMATPGMDPNRIARQMAFQQAAASSASLSEQAGGSAHDDAQAALMAARAKAAEDEMQAKRDAFFAKHGKTWI